MKPYYDEDGITIYHGDCRDVLPALLSADLILTDPPYGIAWGECLTKAGRTNGRASEIWDLERPTEIVSGLIGTAPKVIIWGGNFFPLPISRGWLCWYKPGATTSFAQFELAWTNQNRPPQHFIRPVKLASLESGGRHPAQKPVALMKWCINLIGPADMILDPFMGSGTTLRAAKDMGRQAVGIEIEERYCEIAARRMAQRVLEFA